MKISSFIIGVIKTLLYIFLFIIEVHSYAVNANAWFPFQDKATGSCRLFKPQHQNLAVFSNHSNWRLPFFNTCQLPS